MKNSTLLLFSIFALPATAWAQNAPRRNQEDESIPSYKYKVVVKDKPAATHVPAPLGWSFGPFSGPLQGYTLGPAGKGKAFFSMDTDDAGEMTSDALYGGGLVFNSSWLQVSLGYVEGVVEFCHTTWTAPAGGPGGGFGGGDDVVLDPDPDPDPDAIGIIPGGGPVTTCFDRDIRIYELDLGVTLLCFRFPIADGVVGFIEAGAFTSMEYVQVDMTQDDIADFLISGGPRVEAGVLIGKFRFGAQALYMSGVGVGGEIEAKQDVTVLVGGGFGN